MLVDGSRMGDKVIMGQNSACCNPTTQMVEPESITFPKDALAVELTAQLPDEFVEPSPQILETLRKGEEYLQRHFKKRVAVEEQEVWSVVAQRTEGRQTVHGRGGDRSGGLSGSVVLYFHSREVFKGEVKDSRPTFGVFVFRSGCFYAGEMRGFNAEGQGHYHNSDSGYTYEGPWAKSLPHGHGVQTYASGQRFEGELMYGAKFGSGRYSFASGDVYDGGFYYNERDGKGRMDYANGDVYEGEWKLGVFSGTGRFQWANGQVYEGEYLEGRRHGQGKYHFRNGSYYEGMWAAGLQEGEGVVRDKFDEVRGRWERGELT